MHILFALTVGIFKPPNYQLSGSLSTFLLYDISFVSFYFSVYFAHSAFALLDLLALIPWNPWLYASLFIIIIFPRLSMVISIMSSDVLVTVTSQYLTSAHTCQLPLVSIVLAGMLLLDCFFFFFVFCCNFVERSFGFSVIL